MYLKTPKRYQSGVRRRRISRRALVLAILAGLGVLLAKAVWENQDTLRQHASALVATVEGDIATRSAPPTPTPPESEDPMLCLSRANAAYEAGSLSAAIDYYRCAATGMPNNVQVFYQLAKLLIITGRTDEGLEAAQQAILADPTAPHGYAVMGMALDWTARGDAEVYRRAVAYLLRALDIDPNFADAYAFLSEVYTDQGRGEQAFGVANRAIELDPENYMAYRNLGYALHLQGRYGEAAEQYETAIRLNPKLPNLRIDLAQSYLALERVNDAMDLLLQAVQITGGDPRSYYWLGVGYLRYLGDYGAALNSWQSCVEIDPNYRACWERLGGLLLFQSDYPRAANAYSRAIELGIGGADVYYNASLSYKLMGRCDTATTYARRGLEQPNITPQREQDLREVLSECQGVPLDAADDANDTDEAGETGEVGSTDAQ